MSKFKNFKVSYLEDGTEKSLDVNTVTVEEAITVTEHLSPDGIVVFAIREIT